jgi:hypothetical protein
VDWVKLYFVGADFNHYAGAAFRAVARTVVGSEDDVFNDEVARRDWAIVALNAGYPHCFIWVGSRRWDN